VVVPLGEKETHQAGRLLGMAKTADIVDAVVVTTALRQRAMILTSDRDDIERLVRASGHDTCGRHYLRHITVSVYGSQVMIQPVQPFLHHFHPADVIRVPAFVEDVPLVFLGGAQCLEERILRAFHRAQRIVAPV